jgi:hypothetical protein
MKIPGYRNYPVKIGFSANPNLRKKSYNCGPYPVEWIGAWEGTRGDEREIHERFSFYRLTGEWFDPAPELLLMIQERSGTKDSTMNVAAEIDLRARISETVRRSLAQR